MELVRVGHQVDALSLLGCQVWKQARVERLLGKERIAEVIFARHQVHVHRFTYLVDPVLNQTEHIIDCLVHFLVELGRPVASS